MICRHSAEHGKLRYTVKNVTNQTLEGSLRMVQNIFNSRVLVYHVNLLNENCPFSDFLQNVRKYFYANFVISGSILSKNRNISINRC